MAAYFLFTSGMSVLNTGRDLPMTLIGRVSKLHSISCQSHLSATEPSVSQDMNNLPEMNPVPLLPASPLVTFWNL